MITNIPTATIGQLFSDQYPFFVPMYQRTYAWEDEDVEDFIKDTTKLLNARLRDPSNSELHFFGGMVCVHHSANNRTARKHEIVDGQQRLATFTITISLLIKACRSLAAQVEDEALEQEAQAYAEQWEEDYVIYKEVDRGQRTVKNKLTLSKADKHFFKQLISGNTPTQERESHKRIQKAHKLLQEKLIDPILNDPQLTDRDKLDRLLKLHTSITNDCQVIHIVSNDRRKAYQLFSVLNDRGRTLSDGDLLRAYTLELLEEHTDQQERVENYWDEILSGKPSEIEGFLRAYYPSLKGKRAPSRDLFDKYREEIFDNAEPFGPDETTKANAICQQIETMVNERELYLKIKDGEWPYENAAATGWERDRLYRLSNILRHQLCYPLIMSACKLSEGQFSEIVFTLERFVFRYVTIVRAHANTLYSPYYKHAVTIRETPDNYNVASLKDALRELIEARATNDSFRVDLEEKLRYSRSSSDKRSIKHFLTTLEDFKIWYENGAPNDPVTNKISSFDINQITIEHIYPHNAEAHHIDSHLEEVKNHIGNLSFWGPNENQNRGNNPFTEKKPYYAPSNISLTRELAELDNWNLQEYERRRDKLIDMALKIFTL